MFSRLCGGGGSADCDVDGGSDDDDMDDAGVSGSAGVLGCCSKLEQRLKMRVVIGCGGGDVIIANKQHNI